MNSILIWNDHKTFTEICFVCILCICFMFGNSNNKIICSLNLYLPSWVSIYMQIQLPFRQIIVSQWLVHFLRKSWNQLGLVGKYSFNGFVFICNPIKLKGKVVSSRKKQPKKILKMKVFITKTLLHLYRYIFLLESYIRVLKLSYLI